jgi:archaellum biogenesis ATPase FlaH
MSLDKVILSNLVLNQDFGRKVAPFLKSEYFSTVEEKVVYELTDAYIKKYNAFPSKEALKIDLANSTGLNEELFKKAEISIDSLEIENATSNQWLLDSTEKWCQEKALYIAIMESIGIIDGKKSGLSKDAIPTILSDALSVSFDSHIGHDYIEDAEERYDFYHQKESRIPFDLHYMNEITDGGLPNKTLSIIMAGPNVGKSMFMCHMAAANLAAGHKVLYITLEMADKRIAERIDANLLDIPVSDIKFLSKKVFNTKIDKLRGNGRLVIKEYPTASASAANFRHLLNELKIKKNFTPDIIYIDYINICVSSRLKFGTNVNSYSYIKAIAEEIRGLAIERDLPIVSATQVNRSGFASSDIEMTDTAESFGLPATCDYMWALISSDELSDLDQIMVKQIKNRYGDKNTNRRFIIGVDRPKMRLYDVDAEAQDDIIEEKPRNKQHKLAKNSRVYADIR